MVLHFFLPMNTPTNEHPNHQPTPHHTLYTCRMENIDFRKSAPHLFKEDLGDGKELWLIQAPASLDPAELVGKKLKVGRLTTVTSGDTAYAGIQRPLAPNGTAAGMVVMLPRKGDKQLVPAAPFQGEVVFTETVTVPEAGLPDRWANPPRIEQPEGLNHKFTPFGVGLKMKEDDATPKKKSKSNSSSSSSGSSSGSVVGGTPATEKRKRSKDSGDGSSSGKKKKKSKSAKGKGK